MNEESAFILLFVVATGVALAVRVVRVPYTVALVLAGLAIGPLRLFPAPVLTKELLFSVFLPGLIFEAAFHIDGRQFRENWLMIAALAVLGVVASIALVAIVLPPIVDAFGVARGFSWRHAVVFGAIDFGHRPGRGGWPVPLYAGATASRDTPRRREPA